MNTSAGDTIASAIPEKNPLLIRTIITRILDFLPLSEIKRVRLICREWNTETEPLLRKRAKIVFSPNFQTSDFLDYYSDSHLSTLPFTAFKFTNHSDGYRKGYLLSDLNVFFTKCGKNIKSLELDCIIIWTDENHRKPEDKALDINHWIELLPDNMDKLTINALHPRSTNLQFNLENLARVKSLKSLLLSECVVIINSSNINRIAPSEISLKEIQFLNECEKKLTDVIVNDFVDFSKCSNIYLYQGRNNAMNFDLSKDIVDAKKVEFCFIKVLNSRFAKMKTDFLSVFETPSEAIKIHMKELEIRYCSSMNLTHLPETIEHLEISSSELVSDVTEPLNLPNLKYVYLELDQSPGGRGLESALFVKKFLSWFKNCSNLVELHLKSLGCEFDLAWLPKSVKRIKLSRLYGMVLVGDGPPIDVDVLLLDETIVCSAVEMLLQKMKPKILVKLVGFDMEIYTWGGKEKVEDFISFVKKNTQLEKIVINTLYGLGEKSSSGKTSFLQFVGEESPCYEFNNQIAKAISKEEFRKYWYYYINYRSADRQFAISYDCFL